MKGSTKDHVVCHAVTNWMIHIFPQEEPPQRTAHFDNVSKARDDMR